jgi:hypothetical protein
MPTKVDLTAGGLCFNVRIRSADSRGRLSPHKQSGSREFPRRDAGTFDLCAGGKKRAGVPAPHKRCSRVSFASIISNPSAICSSNGLTGRVTTSTS